MKQYTNVRDTVSWIIPLLAIYFFVVSNIVFSNSNSTGKLDLVKLTLPSGKSLELTLAFPSGKLFLKIDGSLIPLPERKKNKVRDLIKKLISYETKEAIVLSTLSISIPLSSYIIPKELKKNYPDHWLTNHFENLKKKKFKTILVNCFFGISIYSLVYLVFWYKKKNVEKKLMQIIRN